MSGKIEVAVWSSDDDRRGNSGDILRGKQGRPADILLSENKIVLDGSEIPVFQVGRPGRTMQEVAASDTTVPDQAEAW